MRPLRICLLNLDFVPYRSSGLAVYGEALGSGLVQAGHQVTVIAARREGLAEQEVIDDIQVYRVPVGRGDWIGYAWHAGPFANALHRRQAFDIVHFLECTLCLPLCRAFCRQRIPVVPSAGHQRWWMALSQQRAGFGYPSGLLPCSTLANGDARGTSCQPLDSVQSSDGGRICGPLWCAARANHRYTPGHRPLSFSATRRLCLAPKTGLQGAKVLMYVGFGTPRKGLDYLARAMPLLSSDARLVLVGRWERAYRAKFYRALGAARSASWNPAT